MDVKRYMEYMTVSRMSLIQATIIGFVVGTFVYAGAVGIDTYALQPILCRNDSAQACAQTDTAAIVISTIVFQFLGLLALVRANILRPLLVVLAAVATLIGTHVWLGVHAWWLAALISGAVMAIAYVYYTWINRMSQFPVALALTVVSVIVARLLLSNW